MQIALGIQYDGSAYHGWQIQPNCHTIQGQLELALSQIADAPIVVHAAGRTDTGVHATGQVVHFAAPMKRNPRAWIYGANSQLPKDMRIRWAQAVDTEFHARFSATARRYRYLIYNSPIRPAVFRSGITWYYRPLDHQRMHLAAQALIGEHDFTSFRAIQCQSQSAARCIHEICVSRRGDLVMLDITANAFLHHMVRNIAGVLMQVGSNHQPIEWVTQVLDAKDRTLGAETAAPNGLYLVQVQYPEQYQFPSEPLGPVFL